MNLTPQSEYVSFLTLLKTRNDGSLADNKY